MRPPTRTDLTNLMVPRNGPCVSIYLATDPRYPGQQHAPVRLRQELDRAEELLRQSHSEADTRRLLKRAHALAADESFWAHRTEGLGVLLAPGVFEVFDLRRKPRDVTVVADVFHVKPLLRETQSADRFHVLCLQGDRARLFVGNRYGLDEVEGGALPEFTRDVLTEPEVATSKKHGRGGAHPSPGRPSTPRGHTTEGPDPEHEMRRFFAQVDDAVWTRFTRPTELPLILAALPRHQALFRSVTENTKLIAEGITGNPAALTKEEMAAAAWEVVQPHYLNQLAALKNDFEVARARGRAADDVRNIAALAMSGRIATLLVDADQQMPGILDRTTGEWVAAAPDKIGVDDVLDDVAEVVARGGGTVVVVPTDQMPTRTGAAAVLRY